MSPKRREQPRHTADGERNSFLHTPTLAALVKAQGWANTWNEARRLVTTGKITIDNQVVTDAAMRPMVGAQLALRRAAPQPRTRPPGSIAYEDAQVIVFDKPSGISSVPYDRRETGTAMDLIRGHWRFAGRQASATPLHIVHRIDKETSGLLMFAKTKIAERTLALAFRKHDIERSYLCVVHGAIDSRRIESMLVIDRGDGLRGSLRGPLRGKGTGKRAVTHVTAMEHRSQVTLCEVRLETGRTHQIRIHLSESGHPIVGECVYIRDFLARGGAPLASPRLLLHAATLGFVHPVTQETLRFASPLPADFTNALAKLL